MQIEMVPPTAVIDVAKLFGRALARSLAAAGETDARACIVDLVMGRRQLWAIFDPEQSGPVAMFRTQIMLDPAGNWLCVSALAGRDLRSWGRLLGERMVKAARAAGCTHVRFAGSDAWARVLPDYKPAGEVEGDAIFERAV